MKKIAICIPSYNESENISNITKLVDESLNNLDSKYESIIINCDNNSPDNTNTLFNETETKHKKISVVTSVRGKGINLYNFFKYCLENEIDYSITLDADLKSFESNWIEKYVNELENGYDFLCPLYKRRKEEGNTTNHFVVPVLYSIYGKFIRQPIGGDYAFNRKYIETIMKEEFTPNILEYGIDIFMVVTAIVKGLNIGEVYLGDKIHGASYDKMLKIFRSVALGFSETFNHYSVILDKEDIKYNSFQYELKRCEFRNDFNNVYKEYLNDYNVLDYELYRNEYFGILLEYLKNIKNIDNKLLDEMERLFFYRVISFWDKMDLDNNINWEDLIVKETREMRENYEVKNS